MHISSTSITILEISGSPNQYCVEGYGHMQLPKPYSDIDIVAHAIKTLLSSSGLLSKQVVLAIPDSCVISKIIQISIYTRKQDIEEWVILEAEKHIPYPMNEINLDFHIIGPSIDNPALLDVLIVAARTEHVELRIETLRRAGLAVRIIDIESYAIERAACLWTGELSLLNQEKHSVLFDINESVMYCFVFYGEKIIFSREDRLDDWHDFYGLLQQMQRAMQFFYSSFSHAFIGQMILAGSMPTLDSLKQFLQLHLEIPINIANPFVEMRFVNNNLRDLIEKDAPKLMVACGLALRR